MNNPMEMIKMLMSAKKNPQELINKMVGNSNPMVNNLMQMAQKGDTQGIETFARNIFKERGMDFDKEFSNFMNNFRQ